MVVLSAFARGFRPFLAVVALFGVAAASSAAGENAMNEAIARLEKELTARYGEAVRPRLSRGLKQAAQFWRPEDGDAAAFESFARENFAAEEAVREALFSRFEFAMESLDGHMLEINRDFRRQSDLDLGSVFPFDEALAGYEPSAHVVDDFFANKLAFTILLNFPLTSLPERIAQGHSWSRRQWAETRLAERFSKRIPAEVNLAIGKAASQAAQYIAEYNIWMHHLVDAAGKRPFPPKLRLLSHWNLRDEIKADYADPDGLGKQRTIARVFERIATQTIPAAVVNNPGVDWNPDTNEVRPAAVRDSDAEKRLSPDAPLGDKEPDTRYAMLLGTFRAARRADRYSPTAPTMIARRFEENRQIPEDRFRRMLEQVVSSPLVPRVGKLIEKRLGRRLEPFDIWYYGFKPRGAYTEVELDAAVRKKYPTPEAYQKDIPNLLEKLGFSGERARYLASHIVVDPARGSGHAMGAARRGDNAHLRTRVEKEGMNYKGFNIAVHEMGHNVEQTFSLYDIDSTLVAGVPNTAFTEALAFVFQGHDLELLGLASPDAQSRALK
ncbi:MAG TPA: hypothetical protein VK780_01605, partial [Thermoanaerobaculia bacterium]|nr:hypothetical protein [Thermoanaerobaculia bacterium]